MNSNFSTQRIIIILLSVSTIILLLVSISLVVFVFHGQQQKADTASTSATSTAQEIAVDTSATSWAVEETFSSQLQSKGETYYVSPAGNDNNPGTSTELPWRTIQKAANTVLAGDVVSIREGIYDERVSFYQAGDQVGGTERHSVSRVSLTEGNKATFETSISVSIGDYLYVYRSWKSNNGVYKITGFGDNYVTVEGTPFLDETSNVIASIATPIIFKNYPGETVTLNPNRSSDAIIFGSWGSNPEPTDGADYIIIDGINVTKSDGSGVIFLHSNHNVIRNAKIYGNDAPGVAIWRGSTFNTIENNEIFENGFDQPGEGVYIGKSYEYDGSDYNQVISNYLHHPGPAGECAETKWDIRGTVFEGNRFEGCGYNGGLWLNPGSTETLVYNNIFENDPQSQFHIYLRGPANIIFNNLISDAQRGIFIEGNYLNNQIYHNVFYNNEVGIRFPYSEAYRIEIKNNILSGNSKQISGPTDNAIIDYNVFNGPSDTFGTNPILDNPEFVNPTTSDFHLQSSSPAIDAGVALAEALNDYEGNPRPQGNGFDIGAYEQVVTSSTPTPTETPVPPTPTPLPPTATPTPPAAGPVTQEIALAAGWNMVSSYAEPEDPALETLLAGIESDLVLIKNDAGQTYWPEMAINVIGGWNVRDGYKIFMNNPATLSITGQLVDPLTTPVDLPVGWSQVAYLRDSAMPIEEALASINGQLYLVKNNAGETYWPDFGTNQIGDMQPGESYQVYMESAGTLRYPAN